MDKQGYDKITTYLKTNKYLLVLVLITGLLFDSLMAFLPILQGRVISNFSNGLSVEIITSSALAFLSLGLFIQVNRFFKRYFVRLFANKITLQMRSISYRNLIKQNIETINEASKGDIMNKNLSDIADTAEGIRKVTTEIFDSIVLLLCYFISLCIMDLKITLIMSFFIFASILAARLLKERIVRSVNAYKRTFSAFKNHTLGMIKNELYYRGFGVNSFYYQKYLLTLTNLKQKAIKSTILGSALEPAYNAIAILGVFVVMLMGGSKVISAVWDIGTFSAYLTTFMLVASKASKVGKVFNAYEAAKVSWLRCVEYLHDASADETMEINGDNQLIVSHLNFNNIINDLSFMAKNGEMIGVCGKVHCGKSTLLKALSGIYKYEGSIKLCDLELMETRGKQLANFISYVDEMEFFNDSLASNITFNSTSDETLLKQVLDDVLLSDEITNLKDLKSMELSHSLINLSGGQQRRLLIARALYQLPKLLLLDNVMCSIDEVDALQILDKIKKHYPNSILILVSNQENLLKQMDKIIYLDDEVKIDTFKHLFEETDFNALMKGVINNEREEMFI